MSNNPFTELANEIKKLVNERRHVFATVSSVGSSGISIRIDGAADGSAKEYTCNTAVKFAAGDRVLVCRESGTYTVICKVGKPGGPTAKTSDMTQPVGVDADGKLYTKPAASYTLPTASSTTLGGVKPVTKTSAMTQAVGVDSGGALWTTPAQTDGGTSMAGSTVTMGGSTSYYITANTSRELRPNSTSTTYPCYLGTSTYYWQYAYLGSSAVSLGSSSTSRVGFFGTAPVIRQTVSSSATVATLITALKKYGLIG